jgi:hypothetical protein
MKPQKPCKSRTSAYIREFPDRIMIFPARCNLTPSFPNTRYKKTNPDPKRASQISGSSIKKQQCNHYAPYSYFLGYRQWTVPAQTTANSACNGKLTPSQLRSFQIGFSLTSRHWLWFPESRQIIDNLIPPSELDSDFDMFWRWLGLPGSFAFWVLKAWGLTRSL